MINIVKQAMKLHFLNQGDPETPVETPPDPGMEPSTEPDAGDGIDVPTGV